MPFFDSAQNEKKYRDSRLGGGSYIGAITYFVQAGDNGPIKIGRSIKPQRRVKHIQTDCYEKIFLIGLTREKEAKLHKRFEKWLIRGEWYSPNIELCNYIASLETVEWHLKRYQDGWWTETFS